MVKVSHPQKSFLGGEWSPAAQGRGDLPQYAEALKECTNYIPMEEGPVTRRPGDFYICHARDASKNIKLRRYVLSQTVSFILEFTPLKMRFYKGGTLVLESAQTVVSVTGADPAVWTVTGHGYADGDWVKFTPTSGTVGAHVQGRYFQVASKTTDTFETTLTGLQSGDLDGADLSDWSGGTVQKVFEVTTPYTNTQIPDLKFAQNIDEFFIFHGSHEPRSLVRTTDTSWVLSEADFFDGPFLPVPDNNATTLTPSGTSGSVTITASGTTGINSGTGFQTTDIGRFLMLQNPTDGNWGRGTITARASTTSITVSLNTTWPLADTSATIVWRLGHHSDTTGYPTAGTFHGGRLWTVGPLENRIDSSRTFRHRNFIPISRDGTVLDDVGLSWIFDAEEAQKIQWITSDEKGLIAGSLSGEWVVRSSNRDEPLTPTNISARMVSKYGSDSQEPVTLPSGTAFVRAQKRQLLEFSELSRSDSTKSGFDAINLSRFARHLTQSGIDEIALQRDPQPIIWCRKNDGSLSAVSYKRAPDQEYMAWHNHEFDTACSGTTTPLVKSIDVIPSFDGLSENLYMAVHRTINDVAIISIEFVHQYFDTTELRQEDMYFLGDGRRYVASTFEELWFWSDTTINEFTFYGLWHIEGECVNVMFRGADLGEFTVENGAVVVLVDPALLEAAPDALASESVVISRITGLVFTYDDTFISSPTKSDATPTTGFSQVSGQGANSTLIKGEDGNLYFLMAGGSSITTTSIWDVAGDAVLDTITLSDFDTETRSQGMNPATGDDGTFDYDFTTGSTQSFWTLPGTAYFCITQSRGNAGPNHSVVAWFLYKINSSSVVEVVGGRLERAPTSDNGKHLAPINGFGWYGDDPTNDDMLVAYSVNRGGFNIDPYVATLPSITDMTGTFTANVSTTNPFINRVFNFDGKLGELFFDTGTDRDIDYQQRVFFLPLSTGDVEMMMYVGKAEMDWSIANPGNSLQNSEIEAIAAANPNGALMTITLTADAQTRGYVVTDTLAVDNSFFQSTAGANLIPFADAGDNKDDTTGVAGDDYMNPSVTRLQAGKWVVLFPRVYYDESPDLDPTGSFAGVQAFLWENSLNKGTDLGFKTGTYVDPVVDLGEIEGARFDSDPRALIPSYDPDTTKVYLSMYAAATASWVERWVISEFATLTVGSAIEFESDVAVNIGFGYESRLQLLRPEQEISRGPGLGKKRRINQTALLVQQTGPFDIGVNFTDMTNQRNDNPYASGILPLKSGVIDATILSGHDFDNELAIKQDRPFPGTFLAITNFVDTSEK